MSQPPDADLIVIVDDAAARVLYALPDPDAAPTSVARMRDRIAGASQDLMWTCGRIHAAARSVPSRRWSGSTSARDPPRR